GAVADQSDRTDVEGWDAPAQEGLDGRSFGGLADAVARQIHREARHHLVATLDDALELRRPEADAVQRRDLLGLELTEQTQQSEQPGNARQRQEVAWSAHPHRDLARATFDEVEADLGGRIAAADDEHAQIAERLRVAVLRAVQHAAAKARAAGDL